ncbi:hypothetical protein ACMYSQ_003756 [Aspergillus niger]
MGRQSTHLLCPSHRYGFCFRFEPVFRFQPQYNNNNGRNNYRYYEKDQDATDESPPSFLALGLNPMISVPYPIKVSRVNYGNIQGSQTYVQMVGFFAPVSVFASSSRCIAAEKRFQNAGSRTSAIITLLH